MGRPNSRRVAGCGRKSSAAMDGRELCALMARAIAITRREYVKWRGRDSSLFGGDGEGFR